jgi:chromosomal replication initiation ATPase DnaA
MEYLTEIILTERERATIDRACEEFMVSREELFSDTRTRRVTDCRHALMYVLWHRFRLTTKEIGLVLGRDHSTVISGKNKVIDLIDVCPEMKFRVGRVLTA